MLVYLNLYSKKWFWHSEIAPEGAEVTVDADYQPIKTAQLGAATSLFEDLPETREEATAQQLAATRALTEPFRQREQERIRNTSTKRFTRLWSNYGNCRWTTQS